MLTGRVVIVAGNGGVFAAVAQALTAAGALVAIVTTTDAEGPEPAARFRADPADADVWDRVVPHVEQRLGPIDAVVTSEAAQAVAERRVGPDLARRGRGAVIVAEPDATVADIVRTLTGTP